MFKVEYALEIRENSGDWEILEVETQTDTDTNFFSERKNLTHYYWDYWSDAVKAAKLLQQYHALRGREYKLVYPNIKRRKPEVDPMFKNEYQDSLMEEENF